MTPASAVTNFSDTPSYCGHDDSHDHVDAHEQFNQFEAFEAYHGSPHRRSGQNGNALKNTCEMSLIADHRYYNDFGNFINTQNAMLAFISDASLIYKYSSLSQVL